MPFVAHPQRFNSPALYLHPSAILLVLRTVPYVSSPSGSNVTVRTAWLVASFRAEPVYGEVQVPSAVGRYRPRHASSLSNLSYSPAVTRPSPHACLAVLRSRAGISEPPQDFMASATRWEGTSS